mmetsp:Transcript_40642/g.126511  ORF Transcript_40642/g.126511 Transcript_40642/m.126511 type:complete len:136 (-) Transcript_40642:90-497(-)
MSGVIGGWASIDAAPLQSTKESPGPVARDLLGKDDDGIFKARPMSSAMPEVSPQEAKPAGAQAPEAKPAEAKPAEVKPASAPAPKATPPEAKPAGPAAPQAAPQAEIGPEAVRVRLVGTSGPAPKRKSGKTSWAR